MDLEIKQDIRRKARLTRGLLNVLKDDLDCVCIDADTYDLFNIGDSICEAKETIQKIIDGITDLEYLIHDAKMNKNAKITPPIMEKY